MRNNPYCENKIIFKGTNRETICGNKPIIKCPGCDKYLCKKCKDERSRHKCKGPFNPKEIDNYLLDKKCPICHKIKLIPIEQYLDYKTIAYCIKCRLITFIEDNNVKNELDFDYEIEEQKNWEESLQYKEKMAT